MSQYLHTRNMTALTHVVNSRMRRLFTLQIARENILCLVLGSCRYFTKAVLSGRRLGRALRRRGLFIDLSKAPIIEIDPRYLPYIFVARRLLAKYFKKWFIKNLRRLEIDE